jgi:hypothetical protein
VSITAAAATTTTTVTNDISTPTLITPIVPSKTVPVVSFDDQSIGMEQHQEDTHHQSNTDQDVICIGRSMSEVEDRRWKEHMFVTGAVKIRETLDNNIVVVSSAFSPKVITTTPINNHNTMESSMLDQAPSIIVSNSSSSSSSSSQSQEIRR